MCIGFFVYCVTLEMRRAREMGLDDMNVIGTSGVAEAYMREVLESTNGTLYIDYTPGVGFSAQLEWSTCCKAKPQDCTCGDLGGSLSSFGSGEDLVEVLKSVAAGYLALEDVTHHIQEAEEEGVEEDDDSETLYVVEIIRYGCETLGVSFFGVVPGPRENVISVMSEYNWYRGGKYPEIFIRRVKPSTSDKYAFTEVERVVLPSYNELVAAGKPPKVSV